MDLYLVAVILRPTRKQVDEEGTAEAIIVQPVAVMARDTTQAAMKAFRFVPEEHAGKSDRLEVRVLPFGRAGAGSERTG